MGAPSHVPSSSPVLRAGLKALEPGGFGDQHWRLWDQAGGSGASSRRCRSRKSSPMAGPSRAALGPRLPWRELLPVGAFAWSLLLVPAQSWAQGSGAMGTWPRGPRSRIAVLMVLVLAGRGRQRGWEGSMDTPALGTPIPLQTPSLGDPHLGSNGGERRSWG